MVPVLLLFDAVSLEYLDLGSVERALTYQKRSHKTLRESMKAHKAYFGLVVNLHLRRKEYITGKHESDE